MRCSILSVFIWTWWSKSVSSFVTTCAKHELPFANVHVQRVSGLSTFGRFVNLQAGNKLFDFDFEFPWKTPSSDVASLENGTDDEYPWQFTGRLWFRPALVRTTDTEKMLPPGSGLSVINVFGWTIGGVVALEYDTSPVGPYREYVSMGAVVSKRGALGQWGSRLYVSTKEAEKVCEEVWSVPAEFADIEFDCDGEKLSVESPPDISSNNKQTIELTGWSATKVSSENAAVRGGIPVFWTPSIKALWAPVVPFPLGNAENVKALPLHRLRLSASSLRLHLCSQEPSELLGIPVGIGLSVDNVLIEISRQDRVL
uniref:Uncharacterized protein n=1 Tax=Proboscia inermis TaxID=420281 RepID=A0A7S0CAZ3_9STRA|mmetsp:Transcript_37872/g.38237  ORF Transcript_37872/g.38237 Transcript_37872/m.38237 type:complete len:313 (+) Transcript_37872:6-944(+)